jgi:hypothetical protein
MVCIIYAVQYVVTWIKNSSLPSFDNLIILERTLFLVYAIALASVFIISAHLVIPGKLLSGMSLIKFKSHALFYLLYFLGIILTLLTGLWIHRPWLLAWERYKLDPLLRHHPEPIIQANRIKLLTIIPTVFLFGLLFTHPIADIIFFTSLACWLMAIFSVIETGLFPDLFLLVNSVVGLGIGNLVALIILSYRPAILSAVETLLSTDGLYAIVGNPFSDVYKKAGAAAAGLWTGLQGWKTYQDAQTAQHNYEVDARNKAAVGDYQKCLQAGGNHISCTPHLNHQYDPMPRHPTLLQEATHYIKNNDVEITKTLCVSGGKGSTEDFSSPENQPLDSKLYKKEPLLASDELEANQRQARKAKGFPK